MISTIDIKKMAAEIDTAGYAVIENAISAADLAPVRQLAVDAVEKRDGQYVHFNGTEGVGGTFLEGLPQSECFKRLCRQLYETTTGRPGPEVKFYQVFRCLKGKTGQQNSARFHYDSYVLTALLPIVLPTKGAPGDLILIPERAPNKGFLFFQLL